MSGVLPGRVLILDDDEAVGRTTVLVTGRLGMEGRWTATMEEFLATVDEWDPTHVVIDLVMPEHDGIEVLQALGARGFAASVVISSGVGPRVLDAARRSAVAHGLRISAVLPKPFTVADLRTALQSAASPRPALAGGGAAAGPPIVGADLRDAIACRRLRLEFQPKVRCDDLAPVGVEALVRWDDPSRGVVPPGDFIGVAESDGVIDELTDEVMRQGVAWLATMAPPGLRHMAVNISALALTDPGLADRLQLICAEAGVAPERVTLEVTETGAMADAGAALDVLTRCRVKGFRLALDDFGVGYSSLVQLARLPFSELKIDRAFVMDIPYSREARTIVRAVIGLGHGLGLAVTAEGLDSPEALALLRADGCDHAQGFGIGRPMRPADLSGWLDRSDPGDLAADRRRNSA